MRLRKAIPALVLAVLATALPAFAQYTSTWSAMTVVGDWQGWSPWPPNMELIDNNTWQAMVLLPAMVSNRYKFVANSDWSVRQWGDTDQSDYTLPIVDTAEVVPGSGYDIAHHNVTLGYYRVTFHDDSGLYQIQFDRAVNANYASMAAVGSFNDWKTEPNLTLISNNVWQGDLYVLASKGRQIKFVAQNSWAYQWGDLNQSDYLAPLTGTAEAVTGYHDIYCNNFSNGIYRFTFNDSNLQYSLEFVSTGAANYASMAVAATFNGWSPVHNMELAGDHLWQGTFDFVNEGNIMFKFTANDQWGVGQWGEETNPVPSQTLYELPIMGTAEVVSGSGRDIYLSGPLNGRYYFRFNDQTRYYEVIPEGIIQNFETWSTPYSYADYTNSSGWVLADGLTHADRSRYGRCARLDDEPASGQYIQSPYLPYGAEAISFWYRRWTNVDPAEVDYWLQTSTDGTNWTSVDTNGLISLTNTIYVFYSFSLGLTTGSYVRLWHEGGGDMFLVDDSVLTLPYANVSIANVALNPPYPWSNETVAVSADFLTNSLATALVARTWYRVGTNGSFTALSMTGSLNRFTTSNSIPAQAPGTIVYYYLSADFGGPGGRSPRYWPSGGTNDPAWYGITHTRHGDVWVNEVNYEPDLWSDNTNEFVEICGLAASDIGLWTIELLDVYVPYAAYHVPVNTLLPPDTNGFGFYVLGDSSVPDVDVAFTNVISGQNSLARRGSVRLRNEFGGTEFLLTYGDPQPTNMGSSAYYLGWDDYFTFTDWSLCAAGTGSNWTDFSWVTNSPVTPGAMNEGQVLVGGWTNPMPSMDYADIRDIVFRTNIILYVEGTNGWNSSPYYTIAVTNQWPSQWTAITSYYSSYQGGTYIVWFDYPTDTTSRLFFRARTTRSW